MTCKETASAFSRLEGLNLVEVNAILDHLKKCPYVCCGKLNEMYKAALIDWSERNIPIPHNLYVIYKEVVTARGRKV